MTAAVICPCLLAGNYPPVSALGGADRCTRVGQGSYFTARLGTAALVKKNAQSGDDIPVTSSLCLSFRLSVFLFALILLSRPTISKRLYAHVGVTVQLED